MSFAALWSSQRRQVVVKPYTDTNKTGNKFTRVFESAVDSQELVWHRDRRNRTVKVLEGTGWRFQYDNKLPYDIQPGDVINVKAFEYHRLIKGQDSLKLEIIEDED